MAKGLRRESVFPARVSVSLTEATRLKLDTAAHEFGVTPGTLARWALTEGLDRAIAAERKRRGGVS